MRFVWPLSLNSPMVKSEVESKHSIFMAVIKSAIKNLWRFAYVYFLYYIGTQKYMFFILKNIYNS